MKTSNAELKKAFKAKAKEFDRRGDVVRRDQAARQWAAIATYSEIMRAASYLKAGR